MKQSSKQCDLAVKNFWILSVYEHRTATDRMCTVFRSYELSALADRPYVKILHDLLSSYRTPLSDSNVFGFRDINENKS